MLDVKSYAEEHCSASEEELDLLRGVEVGAGGLGWQGLPFLKNFFCFYQNQGSDQIQCLFYFTM
jgi:hypothetical protein